MSDVLEAEIVSSGGLKTGWIDLGKKEIFRDIWVVVFYLGLALPYAFIGYWIGTIALYDFDIAESTIVLGLMVLKVPFFLRLFWAQPVEKWTQLPLGRRRSWMLIGTILHMLLLIPLFILDIRESVWLFVGVMFIALIPRLFAEQAVAGMMSESIPKLGRFNSGINLAYRGGSHILLLLTGWWVAGGDSSPFIENGVVDYSGLQFAGVATAMVTALFGIAVTFVMKEGVAIRGPDSVKKRKVAKTMQEAISNPELDFPESSSTLNKLLAAMRTRTAWLVLFLAFLVPLGDGFEGMFALYLKDAYNFSASQATVWYNVFIFATYLGLLGPWLSDHLGRKKVLRWSALGSIACYAGLAAMMFIGAPKLVILVLWMPTLMVTDWLIFTFITTWAEVSDPRLGPTHMALYQTVQSVGATFIWYGLAAFLVLGAGVPYWVIFLLACIGPLVGYSQFHKLKLGDDYGEDTLDIQEEISKVQTKLAGMPWGVEPVDKSSRRRLAIGTAMAGLILSVALFTGPMVLLEWETEETSENWDLLGWNDTSITFETVGLIGVGGNVAANIQVPTTQGGVYAGLFSVALEGNQCAVGPPSWSVTFSMPDRGNFSDGTNETSFISDDWEGNMGIDFDSFGPNLTNYSSEEDLRVEINQITTEIWWGHGRGSWDLRVEMTSSPCFNLGQANFRVNITAYHLLIPSTDPDSGMVEVSTSSTVTEHDYGEAVGVLLGFPILIATPFLAWIGGRDPETMLG